MHGLTKRQLDVVNFIKEFTKEKQVCPSYREIMEHFNFSSLGSVYRYIHTLRKKGVLEFKERRPRSIRFSEKQEDRTDSGLVSLPFIGYIKVGFPLETFSKIETLALPATWIPDPENTYVLKVKGDTLQEEAILEGDFLIIEARQEARDGQTCLILISDHHILLKRYYQEGSYIRLEACTSSQQPIMVKASNLLIQGILLGVFRSYSE